MKDRVVYGLKIVGVIFAVLFVLSLFIESGGEGDTSRCVDHQMDEGHSSEAAIAICE